MKVFKKLLLFIVVALQQNVTCAVPFFEKYPQLTNNVAYVALGDFPTAVQYCPSLSEQLDCNVFCKRDDLAGPVQPNGTRLFGGNKVRKLEFVLADARAQGAQSILTFGCSGSNHALATAVYGAQLGLDVTCLLSHQSNSWVVQRNLLMQEQYGAQLAFYMTGKERKAAGDYFVEHSQTHRGKSPYVIPPGASMPVGVLGFINAVLELDEQIAQSQMPKPDYIYVPAGSLGTTVGLLMGLQLSGVSTQVVAVAVAQHADFTADVKKLFDATRDYLLTLNPSFESITWNPEQLIAREQYVGRGYGLSTQEAVDAINMFGVSEGLVIEHTYSAKAAACLLYDAQCGLLHDKTVLYWLTFDGDSSEHITRSARYLNLPEGFHRYFA